MTIGFAISAGWNPTPVEAALGEATVRINRQVGARVRTAFRSKLRYSNKTSQPGGPPSVHRRGGSTSKRRRRKPGRPQPSSPLRDGILFAEESPTAVIIGATTLGRSGPSVMKALEEGGTTTRTDGTRIRVERRPFMSITFLEEATNVASLWADAI